MTSTLVTSVTVEHRAGSFWCRLTEVERTALVELSRARRFRKGSTVVSRIAGARVAVVVHSGSVRVVGAGGSRGDVIRRAGDIVGEEAVIDESAASPVIIADTVVTAFLIGEAELRSMLTRFPNVVMVLFKVVFERLREIDRVLETQADDALTKVVDLLVRMADDLGCDGRGQVRVPIGSQSALGRALHLSRESVVRAFRSLRDQELISTDQRGVVVIRDLGALRAGG